MVTRIGEVDPETPPAKTLPTLLQRIYLVLPPLFQGRAAGLAQLARRLDQAAPACPRLICPKAREGALRLLLFCPEKSQNPAPWLQVSGLFRLRTFLTL